MSRAFTKEDATETALADIGERPVSGNRNLVTPKGLAMIDAEQPANTVVQVFQKGYLIADRTLRPAMVAVAKAKES